PMAYSEDSRLEPSALRSLTPWPPLRNRRGGTGKGKTWIFSLSFSPSPVRERGPGGEASEGKQLQPARLQCTPKDWGRRLSPLRRAHGFGERRQHLVEVADDAVVGDGEDGSAGVLVDRHDHGGALHSDEVLDGTGDAGGDVELGRDGLARGADLAVARQPAVVDHRPAGADLGAERARQL